MVSEIDPVIRGTAVTQRRLSNRLRAWRDLAFLRGDLPPFISLPENETIIRHSQLTYFPQRSLFEVDEEQIRLTFRENCIVDILASRTGRFVREQDLRMLVWDPHGQEIANTTLRSRIQNIRAKLAAHGLDPQTIIETRWILGYRLIDRQKPPAESQLQVLETPQQPEQVHKYDTLFYFPERSACRIGAGPQHQLTPKQGQALGLLITCPDRVVPYKTFATNLRKGQRLSKAFRSSLKTHISHLRNLVGPDYDIVSVSNDGYRLKHANPDQDG